MGRVHIALGYIHPSPGSDPHGSPLLQFLPVYPLTHLAAKLISGRMKRFLQPVCAFFFLRVFMSLKVHLTRVNACCCLGAHLHSLLESKFLSLTLLKFLNLAEPQSPLEPVPSSPLLSPPSMYFFLAFVLFSRFHCPFLFLLKERSLW